MAAPDPSVMVPKMVAVAVCPYRLMEPRKIPRSSVFATFMRQNLSLTFLGDKGA
jgi:hypothetical protein